MKILENPGRNLSLVGPTMKEKLDVPLACTSEPSTSVSHSKSSSGFTSRSNTVLCCNLISGQLCLVSLRTPSREGTIHTAQLP